MIPAIVARLTSRNLISTALIATAALTTLSACGSPSEEGEAGVGFAGCEPQAVARHLTDFLNAVSARQEERALRYLAPQAEFLKFTLYDEMTPGGGRNDSQSPQDLHESLVAAIPKNHVAKLLATEVGDIAPFAAEYQQRAGPQDTAGIQLTARIGNDRFLSGKLGLECNAGRIYAGAMNMRRHLEARTSCGRAIGAGAEAVYCGID